MKKVKIAFVPHGINSKYYFPITEQSACYSEYKSFETEFRRRHGVDFVIFWNNRNIRRKQPGDVMLAYKVFCDSLPADLARRVCLYMKTQIADPNGTDLNAIKRNICPKYKVIFDEGIHPPHILNYLYNIADVTINIASNEGFGLSNAESIMAGTVTITNVTGGLQDQCRFEIEDGLWVEFTPEFTSNHTGVYQKHGPWVKPVYPTNRSLQGSIPTPYIFDDRCNFEHVAAKLLEWYSIPRSRRKELGLEGSMWMQSVESGMSASEMCNRMIQNIDHLFSTWSAPNSSFEVEKYELKNLDTNIGIVI